MVNLKIWQKKKQKTKKKVCERVRAVKAISSVALEDKKCFTSRFWILLMGGYANKE